jgi:hypothetical protein
MQKSCRCGNDMQIFVRTVIYQKKIHIESVPIWSCISCGHNEVISYLKDDLVQLMKQFTCINQKQCIPFVEWSENARLFLQVSHMAHNQHLVNDMIDQRIDELLDDFLIAKSDRDNLKLTDLKRRLTQISQRSITL